MIRINYRKIKKISKKAISFWIFCGFIFAYFIIQSFLPPYRMLNDLQSIEIHTEEIFIWDSHDIKGTRMKLNIISEGITYYVWYPKYKDFKNAVENDLLSGNVRTVNALVVKNQSIRDRLLNQKQIVDLRSETNVYYDITMEKNQLKQDYIAGIFCAIFFLVIWLLVTFYILLVYGCFDFKKC